jgi:hypothetical protein
MSKLEIFDNSLIKLIVRKGPNVDRINAVLSEGEPGYTTDTKRLFIGDNTTPGGNVVGNKFLGYATDLTTLLTVPGVVGDIAYRTSNNTLYYIQSGSGTNVNNWVPISTNIDTSTFNAITTIVQSLTSGDLSGIKFLGYTTDLTTLSGFVGDIAYRTSNNTLYSIQSGSGSNINNWASIGTNIDTNTYNSKSPNWDQAYTTTTSISAKANNTYTIVSSKSANWDTAYARPYPLLIDLVDYTGSITAGQVFNSKRIPVESFTLRYIWAEVDGEPTTGNFVLSTANGGEEITDGEVTISQYNFSGFANPTPTEVGKGDVLTFTVVGDPTDAAGVKIRIGGTIPIPTSF